MKILMSAYACESGRGSEPGAGWAWARAAAMNHDVWVLTHATNEKNVRDALARDPDLMLRLHPIFLANHAALRPLRNRGITRYAYYWIWQNGPCRQAARRLNASIGFDVAHHVTYASDWMPAGVSRMEVPLVWGPVGGSSTRRTPRLWRSLGWRVMVTEWIRALLLLPVRSIVGRRLSRRAAVVLGQNQDVVHAFTPIPVRVEPNVALDRSDMPRTPSTAEAPVAVFAGNLIGLKGVRLAIAALARPVAANWRLDIYGDGPLWSALHRQAESVKVGDRVRFLGRRPRSEVRDALARADALVFPSVRDAAGWSVAEALTAGCPVLCLRVGGPATVVGSGDGVLIEPEAEDVVGEIAAGLDRARACAPRRERWSADRLPGLLDEVYEQAATVRERENVTPS